MLVKQPNGVEVLHQMNLKAKYYRCGRCHWTASFSMPQKSGDSGAAEDAKQPSCAARLDEHDEVVRLASAMLSPLDLQNLRPNVGGSYPHPRENISYSSS